LGAIQSSRSLRYRIPDGWFDGSEIKILKTFIPTDWLKSKTGGKYAAGFSVYRAAPPRIAAPHKRALSRS